MKAVRITFDIISCCLPKKNTLRDIITPGFIILRVCEGGGVGKIRSTSGRATKAINCRNLNYFSVVCIVSVS